MRVGHEKFYARLSNKVQVQLKKEEGQYEKCDTGIIRRFRGGNITRKERGVAKQTRK